MKTLTVLLLLLSAGAKSAPSLEICLLLQEDLVSLLPPEELEKIDSYQRINRESASLYFEYLSDNKDLAKRYRLYDY